MSPLGQYHAAGCSCRPVVNRCCREYWDCNQREQWDVLNTEECKIVESYGDDQHLVYLLGKPKKMISARDFLYMAHRIEDPVSRGVIFFLKIAL